VPVEGLRANGFDHTAEFMAEDQRLLHQHVAMRASL
jgi:hypothetical protein